MCSECVQSVFRVCLECAQGAFRVCSECVQSAFSVCSECVQSVFNIDVISSPSASSVSIFGIFSYFLWLNVLIRRGNFWSPLNNSVYSPAGELSSKSREISPRAFLSDLPFWVFLNVVVGTFAFSKLFNRAQNYFCAQVSKEMSIRFQWLKFRDPSYCCSAIVFSKHRHLQQWTDQWLEVVWIGKKSSFVSPSWIWVGT